MAQNAIDLVITQDAIKQVDNLISKLSLAESEMLKLAQASLTASKSVSGISTPSGLTANSSNNAQVMADLQKQQDAITKLHDTLAKKAEQSRLAEIKLQQAREKAFDSFEKNSAREQAILDKQANSYNKTQAQITKLTAVYNDLATRKARYNDLNENEEKRLNTLQAVTTKYNTTLKDVDATIGKHTRNVGNYASGWNGLGNSINQLTREMPAFANSMQTGFMAISNNLPMLFDEITKVKKANVELAASGEPTKSVFKQLAGAVFSWGTALSVGVTLLTVYGAKLWDMAFGASEAEKKQKALNDSLAESMVSINKQSINLEGLVAVVNDENQANATRKQAYEDITKVLPGLSNMTYQQAIATGELTKATNLYIESEIRRIQVETEIEEIAKQQAELDKKRKESLWSRMDLEQKASVALSLGNKNVIKGMAKQVVETDKFEQKDIDNRKKALEKKLALQEQERSGVRAYTDKPKKSTDKSEEDRLKAIAETKRKEIELQLAVIGQSLNNDEKYYTERLYYLQQDFLKRNELAKINYDEEFRLSKGNKDKEKTALLNFQIEKIKLLESYSKTAEGLNKLELKPVGFQKSKDEKDPLKQLAESAKLAEKALEGSAKQMEANKKILEDLKRATDDWLGSFSTEFLQNSGLGSLQTYFDGTFQNLVKGADTSKEKFAVYFNSISETAQEAFNMIASYSQANFDDEYARLEQQKNINIQFAGDSASAKKKIEEDYEKKKKEIANRENKAKQKQAMFNIAIDTAQAIMSIWSHSPDPTGISQGLMTGIISALGLAQIAMVASQKIPQYAQGTDNHKGGLMLVNDGKGSNYQEAVILPSGQVIQPQGRNVLMDAPAGTKVLTHEQQLQEMLSLRGISMSNTQKYEGMTANEMDAILSKHFSGIKTQSTIIDKNGFTQYVKNGNSRTIINAARFSGTGLSV